MKNGKLNKKEQAELKEFLKKSFPWGVAIEDGTGRMIAFNNYQEAIPLGDKYCRMTHFVKEQLDVATVGSMDMAMFVAGKDILMEGMMYYFYNDDNAPWINDETMNEFFQRLAVLGIYIPYLKYSDELMDISELPWVKKKA